MEKIIIGNHVAVDGEDGKGDGSFGECSNILRVSFKKRLICKGLTKNFVCLIK